MTYSGRKNSDMELYVLILLLKKNLPLDYSFKKEYNISMVALDHLLSINTIQLHIVFG